MWTNLSIGAFRFRRVQIEEHRTGGGKMWTNATCPSESSGEHLECGLQPLSRDARLHFPIANGWYGIVGLRHSYYGSLIGKRQGRVPVGGIGLRGP